MDTNAACVTSENSVRKLDMTMPSTSSECTFTTANEQSSIILNQDDNQTKHENNNIDLNALMHSFRDGLDDFDDSNEAFDYNKIKSESYNFLDDPDPEYGDNEMMINANTDSYDVHDLISMASSEPPQNERIDFQSDTQIPKNHKSDKNEERVNIQTHPQTVNAASTQQDPPETESEMPAISENSDSESNDYQYVFIPRMLDDENEISDEEMVETPNNIEPTTPTPIESPESDINDDLLDDLESIKESIKSEHNYSTKQESLHSLSCFDNIYSSRNESTLVPNNILNTDIEFQITERNNESIDTLPFNAAATTSHVATTIANKNINMSDADKNQHTSINQNEAVIDDNLTKNSAAPNDTENIPITPQNHECHDTKIPDPLKNTTSEAVVNLTIGIHTPPDEVPTETADSEEEPSELFSEIHSEPLEYRLRNASDFESSSALGSAFTTSEVDQAIDNEHIDDNIDVMINNISKIDNLLGNVTPRLIDTGEVEEPPSNTAKIQTVGDPEMNAPDDALQTQLEAVTPDNVADSNIGADAVVTQFEIENNVPNNIDPKLNENLLKLEQFGEKIKQNKTKLLTSIAINSLEADVLCNEFATTLENEFKELMKEFRIVTRRSPMPSETAKSEIKTVEERANALKLNQKSKERWLAASSSSSEQNDSDCDDSQQSGMFKVRRRVKRRRLLETSESEQTIPSTQTTEDVIQGIRMNTTHRLGSDSDEDTDDSKKTQISQEPKLNSPQKIADSQLNSDNDETGDFEAHTADSMDYIGMDVQSPSTIRNELIVSDNDDDMTKELSKLSEESVDYSPSYNKDLEQKNEDSELHDTLDNQFKNDLPMELDIESNKKQAEDCESIHDTCEKEHRTDDITQGTENDDVQDDNNMEVLEPNDKENIQPSATIQQSDDENKMGKPKSTATSIDELDLGEFLLSGTSTICSEDMIEREPQLYDLPSTTSEMPIDENLTQILVKNEPLNESNPNNVTTDDDVENVDVQMKDIIPKIMYDDFESDFEGFTKKENIVSFETETNVETNQMSTETIKSCESDNLQTDLSVAEPLLNEYDDDLASFNESNEQCDIKLENMSSTTNELENEKQNVIREKEVQDEFNEIKPIPIDTTPEVINPEDGADNKSLANTMDENEALAAIEEFALIDTEDMLAEFNTYNDEPTNDVLPLSVTNVSDEHKNYESENHLEELPEQIEDNIMQESLPRESSEDLNVNVKNEDVDTIKDDASDADRNRPKDAVCDDESDKLKKDGENEENVAVDSEVNDDNSVVDGETGIEDAAEEEQEAEEQEEENVDDLRDKEIDKYVLFSFLNKIHNEINMILFFFLDFLILLH